MIRKQQLLTGRPEKQMGFFARLGRDVKRNYILYIMIAPVVAYYVIFCYWPMYGIQIAFRDFIPRLGFFGSPWVGLDHFKRFFSSYNFLTLLGNTLKLSIYGLLVSFTVGRLPKGSPSSLPCCSITFREKGSGKRCRPFLMRRISFPWWSCAA